MGFCAVGPFAKVLGTPVSSSGRIMGKTLRDRILTLSFHGYHEVTPSPAAVGPPLHLLCMGAGPSLGIPGRKRVSSR